MDEHVTYYEKVAARFALAGCTLLELNFGYHYVLPNGDRTVGSPYVVAIHAMEAALRRLGVEF